MKGKEVFWLLTRYILLLLLGLGNLVVFYVIFTPLTVHPVYWVMSLIDANTKLLEGNVIFFSGQYAEIINACIGGAAFYLLTILNLSTPMNIGKRVKSLAFLLGAFLFLNVSRIVIFIVLLAGGYEYFDYAHRFVWHFGSTLMVVGLWFFNVWIWKIKEIPVYGDLEMIVASLKH